MATSMQHLVRQGPRVHALHHHSEQQQVSPASPQRDSEAPLILAFPSKTKTHQAQVVRPKGLSSEFALLSIGKQ